MTEVVIDEVEFAVEAGKVREFERAIGARPSECLPLTFVIVAGHWRDQSAMLTKLGLDLTRVVVGESEWEYLMPIRIGDRLRGRRVVVAIEEKRSMRCLTLETRFQRVADGEELVTQRDTIIELAPR